MSSLTSRHLIILATLGSIALLAGAFVFQSLGYAPCKLCFWQRYPHVIAIIAGAIALFAIPRIGILIGGCAAAVTAGIGLYHAGVEQKWWAGPSSCSGGADLQGLSGNALLSTDTLDKVVMCDEVSWALFGLSMPAWNALLSACLVAIWLAAWMRHPASQS